MSAPGTSTELTPAERDAARRVYGTFLTTGPGYAAFAVAGSFATFGPTVRRYATPQRAIASPNSRFPRRTNRSGSVPNPTDISKRRPGRARAQTIPLPRPLARDARRVEVRPFARLRGRAAGDSRLRRQGLGAPGHAQGESPRGGRDAARDDADSGRQRGVRARQRFLRPYDAHQRSRARPRRRPAISNSRARAASCTGSISTTGGSRASSRSVWTCPGSICSATSTTKAASRRSIRRPSTITSARFRTPTIRRRISAPGLPQRRARNGSPVTLPSRRPSASAPSRKPAASSPSACETRPRFAARPTSILRCSNASFATAASNWRAPQAARTRMKLRCLRRCLQLPTQRRGRNPHSAGVLRAPRVRG